MRKFEYKAVPAPTSGTKAKGVKTTEDRFALSLTETLNEMAGDGWEYVRAETLPCVERKGLTGSQQTYQNILIFRRLEAGALPLETATSRPLQHIDEDAIDRGKSGLSARPPEGGAAPSIRAFDD
ncbi:MAG: DUF4177 domain-containing protein [Silicimonas sp.]|jgi:hypothetical protein|nr:DUF4177 domain-containing protein [Silicimonas sp.]